jgi:hypothetical protein
MSFEDLARCFGGGFLGLEFGGFVIPDVQSLRTALLTLHGVHGSLS